MQSDDQQLEKTVDQKSGLIMKSNNSQIEDVKTRLFWMLEKRREDCRFKGGIKKKTKSKASYSHAYVKDTLNSLFSPMFAASFVLCRTGQQQSIRKTISSPLWCHNGLNSAFSGLASPEKLEQAEEGSKANPNGHKILSLGNMSQSISHKLRPLSSSPSTGPLSQRNFNPPYVHDCCVSCMFFFETQHWKKPTTQKHSRRLPTSTICLRCPRGADACRLDVKGLITEARTRTHARGLPSVGTRALWRIWNNHECSFHIVISLRAHRVFLFHSNTPNCPCI